MSRREPTPACASTLCSLGASGSGASTRLGCSDGRRPRGPRLDVARAWSAQVGGGFDRAAGSASNSPDDDLREHAAPTTGAGSRGSSSRGRVAGPVDAAGARAVSPSTAVTVDPRRTVDHGGDCARGRAPVACSSPACLARPSDRRFACGDRIGDSAGGAASADPLGGHRARPPLPRCRGIGWSAGAATDAAATASLPGCVACCLGGDLARRTAPSRLVGGRIAGGFRPLRLRAAGVGFWSIHAVASVETADRPRVRARYLARCAPRQRDVGSGCSSVADFEGKVSSLGAAAAAIRHRAAAQPAPRRATAARLRARQTRVRRVRCRSRAAATDRGWTGRGRRGTGASSRTAPGGPAPRGSRWPRSSRGPRAA